MKAELGVWVELIKDASCTEVAQKKSLAQVRVGFAAGNSG